MSKLVSILTGWANYATGKMPEYSRSRAEKCSTCDFAVKSVFELILKERELKEVEGLKCDKCGCPIVAKIRSKEEKCPVGKW
ncbi:hypothetical protein [Ekhidna sp.]